MGHDPERLELGIKFRKSRKAYLYIDIPPEEYEAFMAAESKGTYLNQVFKPKNYPYVIMGQRKNGQRSPRQILRNVAAGEL